AGLSLGRLSSGHGRARRGRVRQRALLALQSCVPRCGEGGADRRSRLQEWPVRRQARGWPARDGPHLCGLRSEEHTSELQSRENLVCRLLLEKKNKKNDRTPT